MSALAAMARVPVQTLIEAEREDGDAEVRTLAMRALRQHAESFLLGGGHWTPAEWSAMRPSERAAAEVAGDAVMRRFAVMIGNAARSEAGAAAVLAPLDGGAEYERVMLERLAEAKR